MIEDTQIIDPLKAHLGSAGLKNMQVSSRFFGAAITRIDILAALLKEKMVVKVSAGWGYTVFVTAEGKVFACGYGGQLGLGNENHQYTPQEIKALSDHCVVGVAAGDFHAVFVTAEGKVFSCGMGDDGQLGLGSFDNQNTPQEVTALSGQCVTAVAAGINHTVFVTDKGKVFACGNGVFGQLGLGNKEHQNTPQEIKALSDQCVTAVAAGTNHTVFVTDKGKVFACGWGEVAPLGLGNADNHYTPQEVTVLSEHHVIGVALGGYHTVFVTDKGKVFACGLGRYGKLGLGNTEDQHIPQEITALSEHHVIGVAAGDGHTVFVTAEGKVFACGWGEFGRLGLGNEDNQLTPQEVTSLSGYHVIGVAAGESHTIFVTDQRKVLACGKGEFGRLGLGNEANKNTPQEVTSLPATAITSKLQDLKEQEELAQKLEGVSLQAG